VHLHKNTYSLIKNIDTFITTTHKFLFFIHTKTYVKIDIIIYVYWFNWNSKNGFHSPPTHRVATLQPLLYLMTTMLDLGSEGNVFMGKAFKPNGWKQSQYMEFTILVLK